MIYGLICVCAIALPICDAEHAVWAEQSRPIFDTEEECQDSAVAHAVHVFQIPKTSTKRRHAGRRNSRVPQYQIAVTCTETGEPA